MDDSEETLPQGEERSEQFVLEVSEYFERLDVRDFRSAIQIYYPHHFYLTSQSR